MKEQVSKIINQKSIFLPILFILAILFLIIPSAIFAGDVVINEFQIEPSNSQWVELYNKGESSVDLSGWIIDDDGGSQKYTINTGVSLSSKKCISFQSGNFNLNTASSDSARLIVNSEVMDSYSYSNSPGNSISFGRSSDGGDTWITFNNPSRDKLNSTGEVCLVPSPTPSLTPMPTNVPPPPPTSTPSPSNTPKPQNSPTTKPTLTHTPPSPSSSLPSQPKTEDGGEVLGQSVNQATETESQDLSTSSASRSATTSQILILFLIGGGFIFIALAMFLSYRKKLNTLP